MNVEMVRRFILLALIGPFVLAALVWIGFMSTEAALGVVVGGVVIFLILTYNW